MITYNQIKEDAYIVSIYDAIKNGIGKENLWADHSWKHISNVINTVEKMLKLTKCDSITIEQGKIAALLHDIGCIEGKDGHTIRSYEMAKNYLDNKEIDNESKIIILNAIKNHSDGKNIKNIIDATLFFADKLDYTKNRLTEAGYKVDGLNEIQHIKKIEIDLNDNELIVNFVTDNLFNKKSLEEYYFTPKIFNAIYKMSNYLNVSEVIRLNNKEWNLKK